jgi:hypothetical protein
MAAIREDERRVRVAGDMAAPWKFESVHYRTSGEVGAFGFSAPPKASRGRRKIFCVRPFTGLTCQRRVDSRS